MRASRVGTVPASNEAPHLKLSVDGFPATCFGLIVIKAGWSANANADA